MRSLCSLKITGKNGFFPSFFFAFFNFIVYDIYITFFLREKQEKAVNKLQKESKDIEGENTAVSTVTNHESEAANSV